MMHRTVSDLMTHAVTRVREDTPFKDIARTLSERNISAVPVVNSFNRPVGVVSEADLLRKESAQPDTSGLLSEPVVHADERTKVSATTARDLMTSPAVVARPGWSVVQAARVMEKHEVKRMPVVDEIGELVGIVSRADLLRVFLRRDPLIREEISGDVLDRTLGITPDQVLVTVTDGRVLLRGTVDRRSLIPLAVRLCHGVDGVVDVKEELDYRTADETAGTKR